MRAPSAAQLLNVWENGLHQGPIERALGLLEATCPEYPREVLSQLSIGERDACLMHVRKVLFGPSIISTTFCPQCSEKLEWESEVEELCHYRSELGSTTALSMEVDGFQIKFRLPTSADLSAIPLKQGAGITRDELLERCVLEVTRSPYDAVDFDQLPETARDAIVEEMERVDPQSNLSFSLTCPVCGHQWQALFDIVSFLWAEINNWAIRTLRAVHSLARTYGWSEAEILAMSPMRRQIYLEMARS